MSNKFYMTGNTDPHSLSVKEQVEKIAQKFNMKLTKEFNEECVFTICVGGDGAFIHAIHDLNFTTVPFIGVNTGHLGFYQELLPENIESFFKKFSEGKYSIEHLALLECNIETEQEKKTLLGINEMTLRGNNAHAIHMEVFIDKNFLEHFSGDGRSISTPVGSTAYNFSLGGAIVYPSLNTMQLSPIAPITNRVYRSLTRGIVVPGDSPISIYPTRDENPALFTIDGVVRPLEDIKQIECLISNHSVKKIVLSSDSYWNNLRDKIL